MRVNHDFFATRIRIHISWNGSGSGQMNWIRADPDPQHCTLPLQAVKSKTL